MTGRWLKDYNRERPHLLLSNLTSEEFLLMVEILGIERINRINRINRIKIKMITLIP
ncbi:hypothetical protein AM371_01780 [Serratia marcescens]|nr:hypothetical protein AM371_01780 [Serratia marcescens]AWC82860.1 hypothetical protein AM377_19295 [Serratia marcescens]KAB1981165.1 transposase [Serratia marcescens]